MSVFPLPLLLVFFSFLLCPVASQTPCTRINGNEPNSAGCICGTKRCSAAGSYCYADGNLCSDSIIAVCSEKDGLTSNNAACQCGSTKCSAAGSYCYADGNLCSDSIIPVCSEKDGLTANSAACQCGSTECSASGSYCDQAISTCRTVPYCNKKDGLAANQASCTCGPQYWFGTPTSHQPPTDCASGALCYKSNVGAGASCRANPAANVARILPPGPFGFKRIDGYACGDPHYSIHRGTFGTAIIPTKEMCEAAAESLLSGITDVKFPVIELAQANGIPGCYVSNWRYIYFNSKGLANKASNRLSNGDGSLCIIGEYCGFADGEFPNKNICLCGGNTCTNETGMFCHARDNVCALGPKCFNQDGTMPNAAPGCLCGSSARCSALSGLFCSKNDPDGKGTCSLSPTCAITDGSAANVGVSSCSCGSRPFEIGSDVVTDGSRNLVLCTESTGLICYIHTSSLTGTCRKSLPGAFGFLQVPSLSGYYFSTPGCSENDWYGWVEGTQTVVLKPGTNGAETIGNQAMCAAAAASLGFLTAVTTVSDDRKPSFCYFEKAKGNQPGAWHFNTRGSMDGSRNADRRNYKECTKDNGCLCVLRDPRSEPIPGDPPKPEPCAHGVNANDGQCTCVTATSSFICQDPNLYCDLTEGCLALPMCSHLLASTAPCTKPSCTSIDSSTRNTESCICGTSTCDVSKPYCMGDISSCSDSPRPNVAIAIGRCDGGTKKNFDGTNFWSQMETPEQCKRRASTCDCGTFQLRSMVSKRQGCIQLSGCGQTIDTCWSSTVFNTFETWPSLNYVPNAGDTSQINYNGDFCQHTGTACQFSEGAIANHDTCVCGAQLCDASLGEVFCVLSSKGTCSATQAKATGDCEFTTGQIANKKPCICGSTQCNQAGSFCNLFSGCSLGCTAAQNGNVCLNGGFAAGKEGNCRCACIPGYLGENCQAATPCTHGANGQSCQNDATVLGTVIENNCRCQCTNGYDGDHCETAVSCTNGANGQACQNDATVTGTIAADDCKCTCTVGFSGNNCETIIDVDCPGTFTDDEATNHFTAACSGVTTNAATCALTVSAGYSGGSVTCDTADGVYDVVAATATPCASSPCKNGALCSDGVNSHTCACVAGFSGTNCEINIDDCASSPCKNGALCSDGVNSHTCACVAGYSGDNCEKLTSCTVGKNGQECQNNGLPSGTMGACSCQCAAGFTGDNCETELQCTQASCQNGGSVFGTVAANDCACQCVNGFTGSYCQVEPSSPGNSNTPSPAAVSPPTPSQTMYVVSSFVDVVGMSPDDFNADQSRVIAFKKALSMQLSVALEKIYNVRACMAGTKETACPQLTNSGGQHRQRTRRMDEEDSVVYYDIVVESSNEQVRAEENIQNLNAADFTNEFKTEMKANGVDSSVTNAVTANPSKQSTTKSQTMPPNDENNKVEDDTTGSPTNKEDDGNSNSVTEASSKDMNKSNTTGLIVGVIVGVFVLAVVALVFVFVKYKKQPHKTKGNSIELREIGTVNPLKNTGDTNILISQQSNSSSDEWIMHMDKGSSQAYWENKDTGETTWNDPNSSNWEKHYDNKSRNDFYVNNKTGHT